MATKPNKHQPKSQTSAKVPSTFEKLRENLAKLPKDLKL